MNNNKFQALARTELHCHLDGSLSLPIIRELAALAQVTIPKSDADLKQCVTAPESCESLMDYLKTFEFIRPLLQTPEALKLATYDVVRQAALENVIYMEIRFAPELSMDKGLTANQVVEAVLEGMAEAEKDFNIMVRAIVCGLRQSPLSLTESIFNDVLEWAQKGLVGFDFAGNELDFPPILLEKLMKETSQKGFPFTLHAGECGCPNYISQAIAAGAKRLGHATAICHETELIDQLVSHQITA
ncbi:adenosine/AMP deaminase [Streptococcus ictaluri 707-05]|uniref:adenosine deaminase n=1 Tax=Streptococcus ictaluri 707-05 TaxID=764299 RepID=G5K0D8_9STRE|nr:adenosine/AMP deaminase [Streptococcus ictaluri 707-05]